MEKNNEYFNETISIDSRSLLEVADKKHRYGKNLRIYFKEYIKRNDCIELIDVDTSTYNFDPFFCWLDDSEKKPEILDCPRSILDFDTVLYLKNDEERSVYKYYISEDGRLTNLLNFSLLSTDDNGWMFVLKDGNFYACEKRTNTFPRFHHSSFFSGDNVNAAGIIVCREGKIIKLLPHSGHYRPEDKHLLWLLRFLLNHHVKLEEILVDAQRVYKTSRIYNIEGKKSKKTESSYFINGQIIFDFLSIKSKSKIVFDDIKASRLNSPKFNVCFSSTKSLSPSSSLGNVV